MTVTPRLTTTAGTPGSELPAAEAGSRGAVTVPRVLLLAALVVFFATLPAIITAQSNEFGLLFAGAPGLAAAVVLAVAAFCLAVRRGSILDTTLAVAVYTLCFRLPVGLGAEMPLGSSTYKLLGVIDYITQNGVVAAGVDIYNAWAGAFTGIAWFAEVSGITPMQVAHWFPVVMEISFAIAVYSLCRAFGQPPIVALVGAFIAETVNWVGQDYMSPQAIVIVLAIVVLALLVGSRKRPLLGWLSVPLFAAITVTHQLTPYWLVGITIVLGVTGHIRPRWLGIVFGAIAGAFLIANYGALTIYGLFSGMNPLENAQMVVNGASSAGLEFTGIAIKITSAALWGGALLATALRIRAAKALNGQTWVGLVLAFSSLALLLAQSYGGEAIFRVYLFSIAGCAVLMAPLAYTVLRVVVPTPRRILQWAVSSLLVIFIALSALQSFYGGWFSLLVGKDSVTSMSQLLRSVEPPALILSLAPIAPNRPVAEYADFARINVLFDESLPILHPEWAGQEFPSDAAELIAAEYGAAGDPVFLMVPQQAFDYNDFYRLYPPGAMERLVDDLRDSAAWITVTDTPTLQLFEVRPNAG